MHIEWVRLDEIAEWPDNPKDHDIGGIIVSIQTHGYVRPGMIDEGTGKLVTGHGRLAALFSMMRAGTQPPARIQIDPDGHWRMPIYRGISFPDKDTAEAFVIADNQTSIRGGWDDAGLLEALLRLGARDDDTLLLSTGFDDEDMERLHQLVYDPFLAATKEAAEASAGKEPTTTLTIRVTTLRYANAAISAVGALIDSRPEWRARFR